MRKLKRSVAKYRMKKAGVQKVNKCFSVYWRNFLAAGRPARRTRRRAS